MTGDATYLRNQNLVTSADTHGDAVSILGQEARANSEDLGLVLLLDAALGQEDARGGLGLGLDALDEDTVQEGSKALDVAEGRLLRPESVCCASGERVYGGWDRGWKKADVGTSKQIDSKGRIARNGASMHRIQ